MIGVQKGIAVQLLVHVNLQRSDKGLADFFLENIRSL